MQADGITSYTVDKLIALIKENMPFIRGITVSGGEATLYHKYLVDLFNVAHELGLTCYVDTNGFFDLEDIEKLIAQTDKFLFDIKGSGPGLKPLCFNPSGEQVNLANADDFVDRDQHLNNLKALLQRDKIEEVRLVYVKAFYDAKEVVNKLSDLLVDYPQIPLKIIRVHAKGLEKERAIRLKGKIPNLEELNQLASYAKSVGIKNVITQA
jgi:pyruvate-formate lyase-activating enzyme